jgi:hypothetical protein
MDGRRRRSRVEPTEDWEQLKLLCAWPEQVAYEEIHPLTLFGAFVTERARETCTAKRTLYRRVGGYEAEGMESLFGFERAGRKKPPPAIRRHIVDLKAEYPGFNPDEISSRFVRVLDSSLGHARFRHCGASTAKRPWPRGRPHCGWRRRASRWSTAGSPSPATR